MKILTLFLLLITGNVYAQHYALTGKVKKSDSSAIVAATVSLHQAKDSTLIKAALTDINGNFKISNINTGNYFVQVKSVGITTFKTALLQVNQNVKLNTLIVNAAVQQLASVTVNAKKPMIEVLADKTVFNVQESLSATGTTGFEYCVKPPEWLLIIRII